MLKVKVPIIFLGTEGFSALRDRRYFIDFSSSSSTSYLSFLFVAYLQLGQRTQRLGAFLVSIDPCKDGPYQPINIKQLGLNPPNVEAWSPIPPSP